MARRLVTVLFALCAAHAAAADIALRGAWVRSLPGGAPAAGYFTLENRGPATALVGASSPDYGRVMMHRTVERGGSATMESVARVDLPEGGRVVFQPGGYHLMLMHPKRAISVGTAVTVVLELADGQRFSAPFEVRGADAR